MAADLRGQDGVRSRCRIWLHWCQLIQDFEKTLENIWIYQTKTYQPSEKHTLTSSSVQHEHTTSQKCISRMSNNKSWLWPFLLPKCLQHRINPLNTSWLGVWACDHMKTSSPVYFYHSSSMYNIHSSVCNQHVSIFHSSSLPSAHRSQFTAKLFLINLTRTSP